MENSVNCHGKRHGILLSHFCGNPAHTPVCLYCRDFAARSCLLASDLSVKVGDYGLADSVYKVSSSSVSSHFSACTKVCGLLEKLKFLCTTPVFVISEGQISNMLVYGAVTCRY